MLYVTKGEFIQALKDVEELKKRVYLYEIEYEKKIYLRFEKVKSPLDYDIIGYDDKETIRQLKTRGHVSQEQILQSNEILDKEIYDLEENITCCRERIDKALKMLSTLKQPLRAIVEDKYMNNKTYSQIASKYSKNFYQKKEGIVWDMQVKRYISDELDKYFK